MARCAPWNMVTDFESFVLATAYAKAGQAEPPGWTKPDTSVDAVFSPSTMNLSQGLLTRLELSANLTEFC